jgi:hypothetical protein
VSKLDGVSTCYGGRASDTFIFNNCAFVSWLEPNDQIMVDRGFKVKEDLMVVQARLAIPPFKKKTKLQQIYITPYKCSSFFGKLLYVGGL